MVHCMDVGHPVSHPPHHIGHVTDVVCGEKTSGRRESGQDVDTTGNLTGVRVDENNGVLVAEGRKDLQQKIFV